MSRALAPIQILAILVALFILTPLLATGWISFTAGLPGEGKYTLANYLTVATDSWGYIVVGNTVIFALGSSALALAIGTVLAWVVARTDIPFKHFISLLVGMNLLIPGFIEGIGWALIAGPNIGLLNRFAVDVLGFDQPWVNIYTLGGMTFVQGLHLVPPAFFILLPALLTLDASLEEASYLSGASKLRTVLRVNLPLAVPALLAAGIYLFVLAFALFEVPAVLGMPVRVFVFSTMIYLLIVSTGGLPEYGLAAAYGSIVVIISLVMVAQYSRVLKQSRKYATITGKGWRARTLLLGKWRAVALGLVFLYVLLALGIPVVAILYQSLLPFFQLPSAEALSSMSLQNYENVLRRFGWTPFINTGLLITTVPVIVLLLAIPVSWIVVRSRTPGRFVLDGIAFLPLAVPRVVLAVALLYLALILRQAVPLYGTLALIGVAYVIMFLSFGTRALNVALLQVHPELEEAGRVSGSTVVRTILRVTVPLLKPAVFFSWFWILLLTFREVTMAVMLTSPESHVLPWVIWDLWNGGLTQEAAAAATVLTSIAMGLMILLRGHIQRLYTPAGL